MQQQDYFTYLIYLFLFENNWNGLFNSLVSLTHKLYIFVKYTFFQYTLGYVSMYLLSLEHK